VLYGIDREFPAVAVVNLGPDPASDESKFRKDNELEDRDTVKENLRNAIGGWQTVKHSSFQY
jgi:hypothetical protein